jgi:SLT domain-containing protein
LTGPLIAEAVAALARGHSLFAGEVTGGDVGDVPARIRAHAAAIAAARNIRAAADRSNSSTQRLRGLADTDGELDRIVAAARADHTHARAATRMILAAARADAAPGADTPVGRREAVTRMAALLRAQHRHLTRSRLRSRVLAHRLRRLRYLQQRRHHAGGSGRAAVQAAIGKALDIKGIHDPVARARWRRGMELVARRESGYNAGAVNNWDANAANGTPSKGAWQFIAPTFAAYHEPGTPTDIHDLVAQACAFINYARGRYGVAADASNLADRIRQADPRRSPRGY